MKYVFTVAADRGRWSLRYCSRKPSLKPVILCRHFLFSAWKDGVRRLKHIFGWTMRNIYTPNHVIVQDIKLLDSVDVTKGLKPGGSILMNSSDLPDHIEPFFGFRLAFVNADRIAAENGLGTRTQPIINTAMIGAFAKVLGMPPLDKLTSAIKNEIHIKADQNILAARQAYEKVTIYGMVERH
jgi:2-oxoacid:acceptor oxidoreductase gamma subunit (pyruvate/2-ketoisovalerate family)